MPFSSHCVTVNVHLSQPWSLGGHFEEGRLEKDLWRVAVESEERRQLTATGLRSSLAVLLSIEWDSGEEHSHHIACIIMITNRLPASISSTEAERGRQRDRAHLRY